MPRSPKVEKEVLDEIAAVTLTDNDAQDIADGMVEAINKIEEQELLDKFPMPTLVDPSVSLIHEPNPYKKIELAGRTCYKSEDAITKTSAVKFLHSLMDRQHFAMIEHASLVFVLDCKDGFETELMDYIQFIQKTDFLQVTLETDIPRILVSGNIRAIMQRKIVDPIYTAMIEAYPEFAQPDLIFEDSMFYDVTAKIVDIRKLKDLTYDEFKAHFYFTCKFITDRGVTHEIVRHRRFSFAQESTRYCNYSKDKFGNHCTFCKPSTYDSWTQDQKDTFLATLSTIDSVYNYLSTSESPLSPQQARAILPNCLKTEIVVTGPAFEWIHFFNLRSRYATTGVPHPDMKLVANMALDKMNKYLKSLKYENPIKF